MRLLRFASGSSDLVIDAHEQSAADAFCDPPDACEHVSREAFGRLGVWRASAERRRIRRTRMTSTSRTIATSSWPRVNPPKPSTSPVCEAEAAEASASDDDRVS